MPTTPCRYRSFSESYADQNRNYKIIRSLSMPCLLRGLNDSYYLPIDNTVQSKNHSFHSDGSTEHFDPSEAREFVDRCFRCAADNQSRIPNILLNEHNINGENNNCNTIANNYSDINGHSNHDGTDDEYNMSNIEQFLEDNSNTVRIKFRIKIDKIQVSWKRAAKNLKDEYYLKAYLLIDQLEDRSKRKTYHRQWDQVQLTRLQSSELVAGFRNNSKDLVTQILFNNQEFSLETSLLIERICSQNDTEKIKYQFHNKILRLKLERSKSGNEHDNGISIGFVDIDLSQQKNLSPDTSAFLYYPMIIFSGYNKQMIRHNDNDDDFIFEIGLNISHQLFDNDTTTENGQKNCHFCSTRNVYKLFGRTDSLANLSKDIELKCHETPTGSKKKHILNILGLLPPAHLYRVSIHFGDIDLDDYLELCKMTKSNKIHVSFEIKHHTHQPTIFHHHHQRHSLICRTRNLKKGNPPIFDQNFTFFERFHFKDSPKSCLRITDNTGCKLFQHKAPLAEYVNCRSVKQYFSLKNKKLNRYCRLQFSISVKPLMA